MTTHATADRRPAPQDMAALWREAIALHERRAFDAAARCCEMLVARHPRHFDALHLMGFCAIQLGHDAQAAGVLRRALALNPGFAPAHYNLGVALRRLGLLDEALASYDRVIALAPGHARAHSNRGNVLRDLARPQEALAALDCAIALDGNFAEAYCNRGNALRDLRRLEEAVAAYDVAIALLPGSPEPHLNRGNALKDLGQAEAALACYGRAIALRPGMAEAHCGRGNALTDLNRLDDAIASFDAALALQPESADARWNKAIALLLAGDFTGGMALYESRTGKLASQGLRVLYEPEWTGAGDIAGRTLFVYWEQGQGDTIQFCRFATAAAACGARVVLSVQGPLVTLLRQLAPRVEVIGTSEVPARFDCHIALMSLPQALGVGLGQVSAAPYLAAPAAKAASWAERLGPKARPRIGLAWAGNPLHRNDANRSVPLATLAPLAEVPAEWICLHRELRSRDADALAGWPGLRMLAGELADFSDTAAVIASLDLVVTVDTAVAHLAGAMGVPCWIMLPFSPDWRWMLDRASSPWYGSARLFRQRRSGDWAALVDEVGAELARRFSPPTVVL